LRTKRALALTPLGSIWLILRLPGAQGEGTFAAGVISSIVVLVSTMAWGRCYNFD